jgi:predicted transcriptional regulator
MDRESGKGKHMKAITVGILPQAQIRSRMLSIAKGDFKPKPGDPKIWFTSMRSLAEVLSDENRALLKVISDQQPDSIAALALATGRKASNLSRTLKTMSNYGLVEMQSVNQRQVRPIAKATEFRILTMA